MFKRLKTLWKLSSKDQETLNSFYGLSDKQIMDLPDAGDGKAVFFSEPTLEEEKELEREDKGFKNIFGL